MHLTNNYLDLLGKSFSEMKCWDLVVELFKRSGVDLPTYTELDDKMYQAVREPIRGDVLVFSLYGRELDHVGTDIPLCTKIEVYISMEGEYRWLKL